MMLHLTQDMHLTGEKSGINMRVAAAELLMRGQIEILRTYHKDGTITDFDLMTEKEVMKGDA